MSTCGYGHPGQAASGFAGTNARSGCTSCTAPDSGALMMAAGSNDEARGSGRSRSPPTPPPGPGPNHQDGGPRLHCRLRTSSPGLWLVRPQPARLRDEGRRCTVPATAWLAGAAGRATRLPDVTSGTARTWRGRWHPESASGAVISPGCRPARAPNAARSPARGPPEPV